MLDKILESFWMMSGRLALVACLLLALAGCNSDSGGSSQPSATEPAQTTPEPTVGVWAAPAYGLVADIGESDARYFQVTSQNCLVYPLEALIGIDFETLIASSQLDEGADTLETTLGGRKIPGIVLEKQSALPPLCVDELTASAGDPDYSFSAETEFEIFWSSFNELYTFFDLEGVDWAAVYEEAVLAISTNTTREELFGVLAQMVTPLRDFHVELVSPELGFEFVSPSRKPTVDTIVLNDFLAINGAQLPFTSEEQFLAYLDYLALRKDSALSIILNEVGDGEEIYFNDTQTIFWARLGSNIGYLLLYTMDVEEVGGGGARQDNLASLESTLDQVLETLVGIEGLIIDIRYNEGGDDFVSQYIAGRMTNQSFEAYSKQAGLGETRTVPQRITIEPQGGSQYPGPITLLTSMSTQSAAEIFALTMRERTGTTIVGEATAGGFSDQLIKTLPSGMLFTLSNETYRSVNGEQFEGVGVPVDIERPFFTLEQSVSERDLGFEAALEWLENL